MSAYNTIFPHKVIGQETEEGTLAAATKPGTLVTLARNEDNTGYTLTKNALRGSGAVAVVELDELFGKTADTEIAAGARALCLQVAKGMKFTGIVKDGVAVEVNDILVPDADGLLDKATADGGSAEVSNPAFQKFVAEEACTAAGTGGERRICVKVLN